MFKGLIKSLNSSKASSKASNKYKKVLKDKTKKLFNIQGREGAQNKKMMLDQSAVDAANRNQERTSGKSEGIKYTGNEFDVKNTILGKLNSKGRLNGKS